MISFQGTDNILWMVGPDGSDLAQVGGLRCLSTPTVYGDFVFFRGIDEALLRCAPDGSSLINLGGLRTASAPFVCATGVYFERRVELAGPPGPFVLPSLLCRVNLDGTGLRNIGGNQCQGSPYVFGPYVYFRGSDDKLWRIRIDGTGGINLGQNSTSSSPVATNEFVFFRGTDDRLRRVNLDGSDGLALGSQHGDGWKTSATPCVAGDAVYFRGTDDTLWKTDLDGADGVALGTDPGNPWKTKSTPVVDTSADLLFFQGEGDELWCTDLAGGGGINVGGLKTSSPPFVVQPDNQPVTDPATLAYAPLLLIYAPPGTRGTASTSYVEYSSDSLAGTTSSIADSFKQDYGFTMSLGFGTSGGGGESPGSIGFGVTHSDTSTDTSTFDVKQDQKNDIKVPGPLTDGIDHGHDLICIVLSPTLTVIADPYQNLTWNLDLDAENGGVIYLQMDWLADPTLFAQVQGDLLDRCTKAGMVQADFQALLDLNPLAHGKKIDPHRYVLQTDINIPYEAGSAVTTHTLNKTVTYTEAHQSDVSWGININGSGLIGALKLAGTATWTVSETDIDTTTTADTQTSTVSIGGPSADYRGSTRLNIYWDKLFGTFMFDIPWEVDLPPFEQGRDVLLHPTLYVHG